MTTTTRVITWATPSGSTIDLTRGQERELRRAGVWPRDHQGQEFCQVSHGLHRGEPSLDDDGLRALIARLSS